MMTVVWTVFAGLMTFFVVSLMIDVLRTQLGFTGLLVASMLSLLSFLFCVLAVPQSMYYLERGWESTTWSKYVGTVETSTYRWVDHHHGSGRSSRRVKHLETAFVVRYTIQGRTYRSTRIRWSPDVGIEGMDCQSWPAGTDELSQKFKAGSMIDVYLDPRDPSFVVVEPGIDASMWQQFSVGIGLGLASILGLILVGRDPRLAEAFEDDDGLQDIVASSELGELREDDGAGGIDIL